MASNPEIEIADPPSSFRSAVWEHFGYPVENRGGNRIVDKTHTICRKCFKKLPQVTVEHVDAHAKTPSRNYFKWGTEENTRGTVHSAKFVSNEVASRLCPGSKNYERHWSFHVAGHEPICSGRE